jgi:hypothetical protein
MFGILSTILLILDSELLSRQNMRRLGNALGVAAMAVYNRFPDREHLLDAMAETADDPCVNAAPKFTLA